MRLLLVVLVVAGCKSGAEKICEKAAARYEQCMVEVLGDNVRGMVHDNLGVGATACAKSDKTVAMYRECLDKPSCTDFDQCMDSYAERTAPKIDPALPRDKQCAQHVKIQQQALAFMILVDRNSAADTKIAMCLSADDADAAKCLSDEDAAELARKSKELEQECLGWSAEEAGCKLKLPGAKCDGDEPAAPEPAPPELGAVGPAVAWHKTLAKPDGIDRPLGWTADHALVVVDAKHVRALRDGNELWSAPVESEVASFAIFGTRIAVADHDGLHVLDAQTGKELARLLPGYVSSVAARGDHVVVRQEGLVHDVTCKPRCTATLLAKIDEDQLPTFAAATRDGLVVGSSDQMALLDRRGKPRATIALDAANMNHATVTDEGVAVGGEDGVSLVALAACKPGATLSETDLGTIAGCVVARGSPGGHTMVALPGGGVAFDDAQSEGHTHLLTKDHLWATLTYGTSAIAADADTIYTLSRVKYDGPTELIALARDTGTARWHTQLPKLPDSVWAQIAARDGFVAVCVDTELFVFQNHP